jgi:hypothetical protein
MEDKEWRTEPNRIWEGHQKIETDSYGKIWTEKQEVDRGV